MRRPSSIGPLHFLLGLGWLACADREAVDPCASMECSLPNAAASCVAGACVVVSCTADFADCDGLATNGCEADLRHSGTCEGCELACSPDELCREGGCTPRILQLAVSTDQSCALRADGRVSCWGGPLAASSGSVDARERPRLVQLPAGVISLAGGESGICAGNREGAVWCWNIDLSGERWGPPHQVENLSDASTVSVGRWHGCAIRRTGQVSCWGTWIDVADRYRRHESFSAIDIPGATDAVALASAYGDCLLNRRGEVWCWDGPPVTPRLRRLPVAEVQIGVATGVDYVCSLSTSGRVMCRGRDLVSGLNQDVLRAVELPSRAVGVAAGRASACAVLDEGSLWCWGENGFGQLGDGNHAQRSGPVRVQLPNPAVQGAVGSRHACALDAAEQVWCWGANDFARVGVGEGRGSSTPVAVPGLSSVHAISAEGNSACVVSEGDRGACWGANVGVPDDRGALDGPVSTGTTPVRAVAVGGFGLCALTAAGRTDCQGEPAADPASLHRGAAAIAVDAFHACYLDAAGEPWCWGQGFFGAVGESPYTYRAVPIEGAPAARQVRVGLHGSCVLSDAGAVYCWGARRAPLVSASSTYAVERAELGLVTDLDLSWKNGCAVGRDGLVTCWGEISEEPAAIAGVAGAVDIAVGRTHICAVLGSGSVVCWGANAMGQLGRGTMTSSEAPGPVHGVSDAVAVEAGDEFTCARTRPGEVWCWGSNSDGALGAGMPSTFTIPREVRIER